MVQFFTVCTFCFRFADKFSKHMKWFLLVLFILGGGCFLVFTLSLVSIIPDLKGTVIVVTVMEKNMVLP